MTRPSRILFRTPTERRRQAARVADHLHDGGVIAYPTETVYGFGCIVREDALARLARLKSREAAKPFLLLVRSAAELVGVRWSDSAHRLADAFWPGPLTLALPVEPGAFPRGVVSAEGTVAARVSPHEGVGAILDAVGVPITSTSVNLPGAPPSDTADEAAEIIAALEGGESVLLLDGGSLPASPPSTIVDCSREPPRLVRAGAVSPDALRRVVREIDDRA